MMIKSQTSIKKTVIAFGTAIAVGSLFAILNPVAAGHNPCHPAVSSGACSAANPCAAKKVRSVKNPCSATNPYAAKNARAATNPCESDPISLDTELA